MSNKGIVLSGIKETQKALEKFDKDAVKALNKRLLEVCAKGP